MDSIKVRLRRVGAMARGLPAGLRIFWRGVSLVTSTARGTASAYFALMLILSLAPVVQVWLAKRVVDALAGGASAASALVLAALYASTLLAQAALQPIERALSAWLEDHAVAEVDRSLMRAGTRLADLYRVERPQFQDELRLLRQVPFYLPRLFPTLRGSLGTGVSLAGLLLLLAGLHPLLPLVLVSAAVPHLLMQRQTNFLLHAAMADRSRAAREMDYCARVTTEPVAAKEVRVFGLQDFFLRRFQQRFETALVEVRRIRLRNLQVSAAFAGLYALGLAGGFWYVAAQAGAGRLSLGDIALYLNAVIQAQAWSMALPVLLGDLYQTYLYLHGFFAFLDGGVPAIMLAPADQGRTAPANLRAGVELREVSFRYPESTRAVLEEVTTLLPAGKVTALVGANGAGKSTLVKLLTRMYDPQEGQILLDRAPISAYDLQSLRSRIAVVYQDFARFSLTLRENIAVGAPDPGSRDVRVEQAAGFSGADEVAMKLPQGYDTELTRRFEGGVELSGGEWQKVALARGFVRDAALVILDEPTSALDADAEYRLFERFRELVRGRTALIISHRFSTIRMADQIVVLEDGRVVEEGSHAELVQSGGRYATLYEMQAGRYR